MILAGSVEDGKPAALRRVHLCERYHLGIKLPRCRQVWGHNLQLRHQINLLSSSLDAAIRSVSWHTSDDKILVGTAGTE